MNTNKGVEIKVKNNSGTYTTIHPVTSKEQIIGWDVGEVYGPFNIKLEADKWVNGQQTVSLDGISASDIVQCVNILEVTAYSTMEREIYAYNLLTKVESLNNQLKFTCEEKPQITIDLQVWWTR